MRMRRLAFMTLICLAYQHLLVTGEETKYTNKWVAKILGGEEVAERVARDLGYSYKGQVGSLDNYYLMTRDDHPLVSQRDSSHLTQSLLDLEEVKWAGQQKFIERTKRGYIPKGLPSLQALQGGGSLQQQLLMGAIKKAAGVNSGKVDLVLGLMKTAGYSSGVAVKALSCIKSGKTLLNCGINLPAKMLKHLMGSDQGDIANLGTFGTKPMEASFLKKHKGVTKNIGLSSRKISAYKDRFNDPLWVKQWYMQDYRTEEMQVMDHNIVPVFNMDITGKDIYVAVVDDGVIHNHPDLTDNFIKDMSYDYCHDRPGSDPSDLGVFTNSHGTECAGEIGMMANNGKCGVGVAHNAKIVGVLTLCATEDEVMEAKALNHQWEKIDIYSCSWGPNDDGKTMTVLPHVTDVALIKGIEEGRDKKGSLFVFASGNGKSEGDNCGADYVVNHIATIPIASASQKGKLTFYSEHCSAVFATAYSGGGLMDEDNVSLDLKGSCTRQFSGTSASVPIASGIIALTLEANPKLTYRDIMHIITVTAEVAPLAAVKNTWIKNGKGFWVSSDFGFGLLNAENMVTTAKGWKNVPKKNICSVVVKLETPHHLTVKKHFSTTVDTKACQDTKTDVVNFLEHVELVSTIQFPIRGAIEIELTSPSGTKTMLLERRKNDHSKDGYNGWSILSVQNWGESPKGKWTIDVKAHQLHDLKDDEKKEEESGYIHEFTLRFHGTADKPNHYPRNAKKLRKYSAFRLHNGKTSES